MPHIVLIGIDAHFTVAAIAALITAGHEVRPVNSIETFNHVFALSERPIDLVFVGNDGLRPAKTLHFIAGLRRNPDFHGDIVAVTEIPALTEAYIAAGCSSHFWPPRPELFLGYAKEYVQQTLH